jgi:short-subunit dehydrogenase
MEIGESIAMRLLRHGSGTLAVISSVAGERGRESNYAYGAAKAAVIAFCSGLRQRVARHGIRIVTVLAGPVATPMTADMKKGLVFTTPEAIAPRIVRAIDRGKPVVYAPWYWGPVMRIIRNIPESIFMRIGPR